MKKIVALMVAVVAMFAVACGSSNNGSAKKESSGSVRAALTLSGGESLSSISYILTDGPNTYSGTGDVSSGSFVVANVAPGSNYTMSLIGTTDDGLTTCGGETAPFLVQVQLTTNVAVTLTCALKSPPGDGGSVNVEVGTTNCPSLNPLVADQTTLAAGSSTNIAASAGGPNVGALTYTWSLVGDGGTGTFSNQSANGTTADEVTFTCPGNAEVDTVQVSVTDGANCTLTQQIAITCQGGVCPANLAPSCQSGTFSPGGCGAPYVCAGTYYGPNGCGHCNQCGGGLIEGPGDGTNSCYCLPAGVGAPNSGCPLDGQVHFYVNGVWQ